jgi:CRISPR-associated protein Cas2
MLIVASYDIPNTRRRTQVMKCLKDFGRHVQFSVFECDLTPPQLEQLRQRLRPLLHPPMDNVRLYFLSEDDARKTEVLSGKGVVRDRMIYLC